jgi:hypothetical protein
MTPRGAVERVLLAAVSTLILAGVLAACSSTSAQPKPSVSGILSFDQIQAARANEPVATADPNFACGGSEAFGQELVRLANPALAKVRSEWGDVVPGKQVFITGVASDAELFGADLQFSHPFGGDFTFNTHLADRFLGLAQEVGTAGGNPAGPGSIHTEIERGLIPHSGLGDDFLEGFLPVDGDRVAAYGRWIIDCGHGDFHTEVHPPTFISFAHPEGNVTVSHAFYNPYRVTELYSPNANYSNNITDNVRFTDESTKALPQYFVSELIRIVTGEHPQIIAHQLLTTPDVPSVTWFVCAPGTKPDGGKLNASYAFTTRPGVKLTATPDDGIGCVRFNATLGSTYTPFVPLRKDCEFPWQEFNPQLEEALGDPNINILKIIEGKVPASSLPAVNRPVIFDCYDPLVVPPPGPGVVSADQPYPFYGEAKVSWSA